jgi:hypothetical protein
MAHRTHRLSGLGACALQSIERLRGAEEDEYKDLQQKMVAMQATLAEKAKIIAEKVKANVYRRERVARFIERCAQRQASAAPDDTTVCFKFNGGKSEMVVTGPAAAIAARSAGGTRRPARDVIPLVPLSKFKPTQKTYDVVECFWRHYDQLKDETKASTACVAELMMKFPGRWATKGTLRASISRAVHQEEGALASYLRGW